MAEQHEIDARVDTLVGTLLQLPVKRFYPTFISKTLELSYEPVFSRLLDLAKIRQLRLRWEVRCPEYGCSRSLAVLDTLPESLAPVRCDLCGEEYEVTSNMIFPVFYADTQYRTALWSTDPYILSMAKKKAVAEIPLADLKFSPENMAKIADLGNSVVIFNVKGDVHVAKNDFSQMKIEAKDSQFVVGADNVVNFGSHVQEIKKYTDELYRAMESELDKEKQEELTGIVKEVISQLNEEQPRKTLIETLLKAGKAVVSGITTATGLVAAYQTWSGFIQSVFN